MYPDYKTGLRKYAVRRRLWLVFSSTFAAFLLSGLTVDALRLDSDWIVGVVAGASVVALIVASFLAMSA